MSRPRQLNVQRVLARLISLALVAGLILIGGQGPANALGTITDPNSWAPAGTSNVAPTATATANAHEVSSWGVFSPDKLVDLGTSPDYIWSEGTRDVNARGWAQLDFPAAVQGISRIVLFPRSDMVGAYFPASYTVSLLDGDGEVVWDHTVVHHNSSAANHTVIKSPDVIDLLAPESAQTVRIDVLARHAREGGGLQIAEVAVFAGSDTVEQEPNLALTAVVSSSSSYETPHEEHAMAYVHDGAADVMNWSTSPFDRVQDPATPAWLAYELTCTAALSKFVVYPRIVAPNVKFFPDTYHLESSDNGVDWVDIPGSVNAGIPTDVELPQVFVPDVPVTARHVRLHVDTRSAPPLGVDGYLIQVAEFAVYGSYVDACVTKAKPALAFKKVGDTDSTWFTSQEQLVFSSSNEEVATVDATGTITAADEGTAVVTAALPADPGETVLSIDVEVDPDARRIGEEMLIAGFYGPRPEHVNDTQFGYMADFGMDLLMAVQHNDYARSLEGNLEQAMLAAKHGFMYMPSSDSRLGCWATAGKSPAEIKAVIDDYTNVPAVAGFLLCDEAMPPTNWATAFNTVREETPDLYPHYNFCPWGACGVDEASVRSWLDATGGVRSDWDAPDYLMYDRYPLKGTIDFNGWFDNLERIRALGNEYKIKTATYLQSVGYGPSAPTRRPSSPEIVWEANTALAYGYKQLAYFTYWQPACDEYCAEIFTEGIIDSAGNKSDRFDDLKQLNSEIHALGPTLMKLDTHGVVFNGAARGQTQAPQQLAVPNPDGTLPAGTFFVRADGSQDLLLSHLVDRETRENYLFVVNNSFSGNNPVATDVTLTFDAKVTALQEISRTDGTSAGIALENRSLALSLGAGDGRLYRLAIRDTFALDQAIADAGALQADAYTTSTWGLVAEALDEAEQVLEDVEAGRGDQESVDAAVIALNTAMAGLAQRGDPKVLAALINAADGIAANLDGYTEASGDRLTQALATARTGYADRADMTQDQLDPVADALLSAINELVPETPAADKTVLQHLHKSASSLSNAKGSYTDSSWSRLQAELADTKRVLDDASASQAQIDAATMELTSAVTGLTPKYSDTSPVKPQVNRIKLNQSQLRLVKGKSLRLEEAVYYTNAPTSYAGGVDWKSSNTRIATVANDGTIRARKSGTVTITATTRYKTAAGKKAKASIKVTVVSKKPKSRVTKVWASVPRTLTKGKVIYVTGKYSSAKATGVKVTYATSRASVAEVNRTGRIIAKGKGTTKITIKAGGRSKTYTLTVR